MNTVVTAPSFVVEIGSTPGDGGLPRTGQGVHQEPTTDGMEPASGVVWRGLTEGKDPGGLSSPVTKTCLTAGVMTQGGAGCERQTGGQGGSIEWLTQTHAMAVAEMDLGTLGEGGGCVDRTTSGRSRGAGCTSTKS